MTGEKNTCECRAARCSIADKAGFLGMLAGIARDWNTHIICFDADKLAGRRHAGAAVRHAVRSFEAGTSISHTLEMEALLYASGSRQCNVAAGFGISTGENRLWVCCYPPAPGVWDALAPVLRFRDGAAGDRIDCRKQARLMQLYDITAEEIAAAGDGEDRIADLVLERVALLDVLR
jgi:KEOPS complex subunit Cgi121